MPEHEPAVFDDLSLGFLLDHEVSEIEHVHLRARKRVEGVGRRFDDGLALRLKLVLSTTGTPVASPNFSIIRW